MTAVTVIVPIGPGHADIARRAIRSVEDQTVACDLLAVYDPERRGAGWARNQGLAQAKTPYVIFLDADDYLEPTFAERTLTARRPLRYVYGDWYEDGVLKIAPDRPWCGGTWHVITALIPTEWAREVGGFDESLPGAEDTDFYLKLATRRLCGQRIAEPLFHYSGHGLRSHELEHSGNKDAVMREIGRRYKGKMGCCGDNPDIVLPPQGEKLPGDVLAAAIWGGNQIVRGRMTGRTYPRTGNGKLAWVDPRDVQAMPDKWRLAPPEPTVDEPPVLHSTAAIAQAMMAVAQRPPVAQPIDLMTPIEPAKTSPDVATVLRLGRR